MILFSCLTIMLAGLMGNLYNSANLLPVLGLAAAYIVVVSILFSKKPTSILLHVLLFAYIMFVNVESNQTNNRELQGSHLFAVQPKTALSTPTKICPLTSVEVDPVFKIYSCSMVFGFKKMLPVDLRYSLNQLAIAHILSISGLHFGLIFLMVSYSIALPLRLLLLLFPSMRRHSWWINRYFIPLFILCLLGIYRFSIMGSAASDRAFAIACLLVSAKLVSVRVQNLDLLAVSFILCGIIHPTRILETGNLMSWSCYLVVLYASSKKSVSIFYKITELQVLLSTTAAVFIGNLYLFSPLLNLLFVPLFIFLYPLLLTVTLLDLIFDNIALLDQLVVGGFDLFFTPLIYLQILSLDTFQVSLNSPTRGLVAGGLLSALLIRTTQTYRASLRLDSI